MQYEDRLTIATPEGVSLEVTLAGPGSRIAAAFLDALIQGALLAALLLIGSALLADGDAGAGEPEGSATELLLIGAAVVTAVTFVVVFFYSVFFETLWSGRTPGKRALGLRVVRDSGARINFKASMVRNLVRLVDLLPTMYIVGLASILASTRNQRVGDIVAGTLVIRDRPSTQTWAQPSPPLPAAEGTEAWDVSGITDDDLAAARAFLERRHHIAGGARQEIALDLETKLRPKVPGAAEWRGGSEGFLEYLVATKSARS